MKFLLKLFCGLVVIGALSAVIPVALVGCKSTPQQIAYQSVSVTQISAETALGAYNEFAKQGKTTVAQNREVADAYKKYQAAMLVACDAGMIYAASGGTNVTAYQEAMIKASIEITDLVHLVQSFGIPLNVNFK